MNKNIVMVMLIQMLSMTAAPFKILHIGLHKGCINDFNDVAHQLSLDVTNWYIHDSRDTFDPEARGNEIYNITAERAARVWELNKDYFNQFDAIITSDTAPLSRIFLQNNWQKPLIIWICNRFDYGDDEASGGTFPDPAYYNIFRSAIAMPNVHIVSYTPYEWYYARQKGVNIGTQTIRPIGVLPKVPVEHFVSSIPAHVDKAKTIFIYPRMDSRQEKNVREKCKEYGITAFYGGYNGPDDLTDFKGVLYFPYQWSNLALFENIQRGIVHFVPSKKFIQTVASREPIRYHTFDGIYFTLCEWYCDEYKDLFVYFDSWQDLAEKIKSTDYAAMHTKIQQAGLMHWQKNVDAWRALFAEIIPS